MGGSPRSQFASKHGARPLPYIQEGHQGHGVQTASLITAVKLWERRAYVTASREEDTTVKVLGAISVHSLYGFRYSLPLVLERVVCDSA